jgi:hypothetical protein
LLFTIYPGLNPLEKTVRVKSTHRKDKVVRNFTFRLFKTII